MELRHKAYGHRHIPYYHGMQLKEVDEESINPKEFICSTI